MNRPPSIEPRRANSTAFARYGQVISAPPGAPTASDDTFSFWSDLAHCHISGETEIGLCRVFRQDRPQITWMERHDRTPEILIPLDAPFLLPTMDDRHRVELFRIDPGEAVVIDTSVWHSACLPVTGLEATYLVIFRRGTPAEDVTKREIEPIGVVAAD